MYDEEEEINRLIDEAADEYISLEELLEQKGMTFDTALSEIEKYRKQFFDTLNLYGIDCENISRICFETTQLLKKDQSDSVLFLYTSLLSENGLLFGNIEDSEQKIRLWVEQCEYVEYIIGRIKSERILSQRFKELTAHKQKKSDAMFDRKEQALLYDISTEHPFLAKNIGNIYLENLGELIRKGNGDTLYSKIKPFIYSAILSSKHQMMLTRANYSTNISAVFRRTEYKIHKDNGKNFDKYKEYIELYAHLRCCYADESDIEMSDYCFANLNNLSEWFYENCDPLDEIPMTLRQTVDIFARCIEICDYEYNDIDESPVLDIAYDNILYGGGEYADFINAMLLNKEDISEYAQRLYNEAEAWRFCDNKDGAIEYAKVCLLICMEDINRNVLVNASEYL